VAQDETVKVRVGAGALAEWREAAAAAGQSLSEWLRDAAQERIERSGQTRLDVGGGPEAAGSSGLISGVGATSSVRRAPRRELCPHRISPAAFCKVCDA
jgi:hypothetical protein